MTNKTIHDQAHESLVNYLRTHRLKTGFTQDDLAGVLRSINRNVISRHERQEKVPSLLVALSYETFYQVPVSEIFIGLAKSVEFEIEANLAEFETFLGHQSAVGPRAAAIARKLEWLSERKSSGHP